MTHHFTLPQLPACSFLRSSNTYIKECVYFIVMPVVATVRMNERQCATEFKRICGAIREWATGKTEKMTRMTVIATVRMNKRQCAIEFKRMCGAIREWVIAQGKTKKGQWMVCEEAKYEMKKG
jgi:hypothetical protein